MSNTFIAGSAFSAALGRLSSSPAAFDVAMRHATMHCMANGQTTAANRLISAARDGGHMGGLAWRVVSVAMAEALQPFATLRADGWTVKKGAEYLGRPEAEARAAGMPSVTAAMEAAEAAKAEAAAARKAAKSAAKAAEAEKAPVPVVGHSLATLAALETLASAASVEDSEAAGKPEAEALAVRTLAARLATMPGALSALQSLVTHAATIGAANAAAAEALQAAEALRVADAAAAAEALAAADAGRAGKLAEARDAAAVADAAAAAAVVKVAKARASKVAETA